MDSKPTGLFGYKGQPEETTVAGRIVTAGEATQLGFESYADTHPGTEVAEWNALHEETRRAAIAIALDVLEDTADANALSIGLAPLAKTAGELLGMNLIDAALTECKALQRPWSQLTEDQQRDVLERITAQVKSAVGETIRTIVTSAQPHIVCELESITIKKGAKATLSIPTAGLSEALIDACGQPVLLVIGGQLQAPRDIQTPRPDPSQATLLPPDSGVVHSSPED